MKNQSTQSNFANCLLRSQALKKIDLCIDVSSWYVTYRFNVTAMILNRVVAVVPQNNKGNIWHKNPPTIQSLELDEEVILFNENNQIGDKTIYYQF